MDSSKSPHSHPGSGCSAGNNPPEQPPYGGGGSTSNRKMTEPEDEEDEDVDITGLSTPTDSLAGKETEEDTATTTTINQWRTEEINLLKGILDFYSKTGRYPYTNILDMQDFFKNWVQERGFFREEMDLNIELDRLNTRFLMNMEKKSNGDDIEAMMDPTEIEIFRLSNRVWGKEDDDHEETEDHGGDEDAAMIAGGVVTPRRKEEIDLLSDLLDFYKENGGYPYDDSGDLLEFYKK